MTLLGNAPSRPCRVPVVLPLVTVTAQSDGTLRIEVNGGQYGGAVARADLGPVLDRITDVFDSPVRVEVHELDGSTFVDVLTARTDNVPDAQMLLPANTAPVLGEIGGAGFAPGEPVAVAVVVADRTADVNGSVSFRVPPALLAGRIGDVVLLGRSSGLASIRIDHP
ncbi:hypothetical protein [Nocardioides caldifontis]|uniref:hypothetical protein n=1 Tax=Nocardioides caldifontis TaxID=2588938 RepID=UPI0011DF0D53|nr:hypothetical protein [Nocardioides caldifontis]